MVIFYLLSMDKKLKKPDHDLCTYFIINLFPKHRYTVIC